MTACPLCGVPKDEHHYDRAAFGCRYYDGTEGHEMRDSTRGVGRMKREWQPIETAPKDGREVLLRVRLRAGIRGKCLVGHYMAGGYCISDHPPIDAGWYFWNGCMFDKAAEPTHWMPLPDSPADNSLADPSNIGWIEQPPD